MKFKSRAVYSAIIICLLIITLLTGTACNSGNSKDMVKLISSVEPGTNAVYPLANTQIICNASDPNGGSLVYTWICNEGTVKGSGSEITWVAPNKIGQFPIMVTVQNTNGDTDEAIVKMWVVENPGCPSCRR